MRDANCLRHCYAGVIAIVGNLHIWNRNYQIDLLTPTRSLYYYVELSTFYFTSVFLLKFIAVIVDYTNYN